VGVLAFRAFPSLPTRLGGAARFLAAAASPFSTDAAASVDLRARETVATGSHRVGVPVRNTYALDRRGVALLRCVA